MELFTVEVNSGIEELPLRVMTGYAPQDNPTSQEEIKTVNEFYSQLEEQITDCQESGCGLILELDSNAKLGKSIIRGEPNRISENGKILRDIIERRDLVIVNTSDKCQGVITRKRETVKKSEESVIDYVQNTQLERAIKSW